MIFSTPEYLFKFLPVVFVVFFALKKLKLKNIADAFLILSSFAFYIWGYGLNGSWWYVFIFAFSVLVNFGLSKVLVLVPDTYKLERKLFMLFGIAGNVAMLFLFKYTAYITSTANTMFSITLPGTSIVLPVGMSFYTFIIIAYLYDTYKHKSDTVTFREYLLFVTFFPQINMGPISRQHEIIPQIRDEKRGRINTDNIMQGLSYLSIGFAKKVLLATPLMNLSNTIFQPKFNLSPITAVIGLFTGLLAVYFDFSGYVDMAIGSGLFFNIRLPDNLNSPLKARNMQDYWQRRHITLTRFFTEFIFKKIYNPVFGILSFCGATMITFFISGLWHGTGFRFVIWGLLHGVLVSVVGVTAILISKKHFMPNWLGRILTMCALLILGGFFFTPGLSAYFTYLRTMFDFGKLIDRDMLRSVYVFFLEQWRPILTMVFAFIISVFAANSKDLVENNSKKPYFAVFCGAIFVLSAFFMAGTSSFLYNRF